LALQSAGLAFRADGEIHALTRVVMWNSDFLWEFNEKFGIDRSAVAMDSSIYALEFPILMTTFWTWASIAGLSMPPNLVPGQSA